MANYFIAPHVHLCATDGATIMLDLKADQYIGFGPRESRHLSLLIDGWPNADATNESAVSALSQALATTGPPSDDARATSTLLDDLVKRKVITTDPAKARRPPSAVVERAAQSAAQRLRRPIQIREVAAFFRAVFTVRTIARCRSLEHSLDRIARRKHKHRSAQVADADLVCHLLAVHADLRVFLFTAKDACLFDSLVLVEFLAYFQIYPMLVIGVQSGPFAAHSWVQQGEIVANDTPENVLHYTPILAI